jgi:actin-related protein 5
MYRETCYFSSDYDEEIRTLADPAKMAEMTKVVQFPFTQPVSLRCGPR